MKKTILISFLSIIAYNSFAIDYTLNFSGSGASSIIDSVIVQNLTKGSEVVVYSGSVLKLTDINTDIKAVKNSPVRMTIFNNDLSKTNSLRFDTETSAKFTISAYNMQGMKLIEFTEHLQSGENLFDLRFPQGIFIINITGGNNSISDRFVSSSANYRIPEIKYRSFSDATNNSIQKIKTVSGDTNFNYAEGDLLLFKAKSGNYCTLVSDVPTESKTINFEFVECKDADGKHYAVTKIGNQFWMAENLSYLPVAASDFAVGLEDENAWQAKTTPYYYVYDKEKYGVMYNWYAALKVAPPGWHLPSKEEWFVLRDYLGGRGIAGGKMKSTSGWSSPNVGATNSSGFSALGGGYRGNDYGGEGSYTAMWSSTEYNLIHSAYPVYLGNSHSSLGDDNDNKYSGFYVRCVMDSVKPLDIETSLIPAGTFIMGSPESEISRGTDETQHQVTLSAFRMSKYEITNSQFAAFLNANGIGSDGIYKNSTYPNEVLIYSSAAYNELGLYYYDNQWRANVGYENLPVVYVTWFGAFEFAKHVGGTLPTEAQWEYACRGGTSTPFNTGDCLTNLQANYIWASSYVSCNNTDTQKTYIQNVGLYPANQYGLHDMHGNVYEWCGSGYDTYPTTPQTNPAGGPLGYKHVIRGGSWDSSGSECRSAARRSGWYYEIANFVGFRVAFAP
ncbi:MAG: SUMF1/EgtB/PvdO family nonheme iron enzyme [Paludibacter sp.]|nr:SUMF1/EgtB/PvdO family nonheme iron enzyme [Paludibacter sp.]